MKFFVKQHVLLVLTGSLAFSGKAFAAQALASDIKTSPEEEMVITAQIREQSVMDVPVSVNLITKNLLDAAGVANLSDIEHLSPSVNFGAGVRQSRGEISIRGIGDHSRNIGSNARVVVYVDGVPYVRSSTFNIPMHGVEQVEVIRGPQGTFFGTNAVGGAINITTHTPTGENQVLARTEAGSYGLQHLALLGDAALTDSFMLSTQVSKRTSDGYLYNSALQKHIQGEDTETARVKMRWLASEALEIQWLADWLNESADATNGIALFDDGQYNGFSAAPGLDTIAHDTQEYESRNVWGSAITAKVETSKGYEWVSITALRDNDFKTLNEEDYSAVPAVDSYFNEESRQKSQEIRWLSPIFAKYDFVVGAFAMTQDIHTGRYARFGSARTVTPGTVENTSYSFFGHANIRFAKDLELSLGARWVNEDKSIHYSIEDQIGQFDNGTLIDTQTFNEFLPKLGLQYTPNENTTVYANIAKSFKSGGWNADFVADLTNTEFKPEYATNVEIGLKSQLFDESLLVNVAVFHTNIDDLQVFQFVDRNGTTSPELTNAGEATSEGMELEITYAMSSAWQILFNTAFTDAKFDAFADGGIDAQGNLESYTGHSLPYAPRVKSFAALQYAGHNITSSISYSFTDDYYSNPNNKSTHEIDAYQELNARLAYQFSSHWDIAVWGKNLEDSRELRYQETSFLQVRRGFYQPPRSYGISLQYSLK